MSTPDANGSSSQPTAEPLLSHQLSSIPPETPSKEEPEPVAPLSFKTCVVGTLNWAYLFMPLSLFAKNQRGHAHMRFRRDFEFVPLLLNIILGIQHACVALGHIVPVPLMLNFMLNRELGQYALQSAVIIAGIGSLLQCIQIKIPNTPYQIGTGMASLLGNSHVMLAVFMNRVNLIRVEDGISIDDAYGKVLGTAAVCSLLFVALSLIPRKYVKKAFSPVVTAIIIILVGMQVLQLSVMYWGGGQLCYTDSRLPCRIGDVLFLPFGSPEFLGLGLFVMVLFLLIELFGTAFLRHNIVLVATLIVYAVSAILTRDGHRYVSGDEIDAADNISFLWTNTYKLGFHKRAVLPLIGAYLATYMEATGILTASVEEAGLNITGEEEDERIQGGLIVTGIVSLFAVLATGLPVVPISQTNSVTYVSRISSRFSGISGAIWLFIFGVFAKVLAFFFSEIPLVVRGGIFTLLCATVILTGIKILCRLQWNRRTSIIVILSLATGLGNLLVHRFISEELWPKHLDDSAFVESLRSGVLTIMEVDYVLGGVTAMILHLILPQDMELGYLDALPEHNE